MLPNPIKWSTTLLLASLLVFSACTQEQDEFSLDSGSFPALEIKKFYQDLYAGALNVYALADSNKLVQYATYPSLREEKNVAITGLQSGEKIMAIDFRPASGQLYGVSNQSRLYIINHTNGIATALSSTPFTPSLSGTQVGIDFNPTVDRIRLVTSSGQNLRLNPETGMAISPADGNLNPGTPSVVAAAYTNSFAGSTATTLYDIDVASDKLFIQNPPNNGTLVEVGPLGLDADGEGGFDISPQNDLILAVLSVKGIGEDTPGFYSIDLKTGLAKKVGKAKKGVIDIAIPTLMVAYSIAGGTNLYIFNPLADGSRIIKPLTGLQGGETILGLDMRPANGQLYALGSTSRLYTINTANGMATAVGTGFTPALSGTQFGFDFNPTVDRIRLVSNTGQNLRLHPTLGTVVATDAALNPGSPAIDASAYINNFAGATTTTLYNIDYEANALFIQAPPNDGKQTLVGPLGVNIGAGNGFDIGGTSGKAYAVLKTGEIASIFSINLSTGQATRLLGIPASTNGFALGNGF
jgi:hypothetical protein